jgi:hypothetical protein
MLLAVTPIMAGAADGVMKLRIVDEHGHAAHARGRLLDATGRSLPVLGAGAASVVAAHPNFPELGVVLEPEARLNIPPSAKVLLVDRGPEYRRVSIPLDAAIDESVERPIKLDRWIDMAAKGWWSGDLHVHRSVGDIRALMQSADLHFAPTISCFNDAPSSASWAVNLTAPAGLNRIYSIDNCEDERKWGAALFIGVKRPMRLYDRASEYPLPEHTWAEARSRGAFIDLEKVIWWQSPVMVAIGKPDSIGVAVNHFTEDAVSTRASLARPRDESKYGGPEGFARYIGDLYLSYLSAGFRIPASAGSANGVSRNPLGYNRSYVYLGSKFGYSEWLAGQKAGRNFVTNGPMLEFIAARHRPGAILPGNAGPIEIEVACTSRDELDRVEVVSSGEPVDVVNADSGATSIRATRRVRTHDGGWVIARCYEKDRATMRFAHTSPVWIGKTAHRSPQSLRFLLEWVAADESRIRAIPEGKITESQREELLAATRRAAKFYE